jgi:WD40-like Beta Propeller Repeat
MRYRVPPFVTLASAFAAAVLLTGCSLFGDDEVPTPVASVTTRAPSSGTPQEPGPPASTPDPPGSVYDVAWLPASPIATLDTPESEAPLADVVPDVEAVWRLFVVGGASGEPRQIQASGRWLHAPVWQEGDKAVTVEYFTRVEGPPGYVFGYTQLDLTAGAADWDFRTGLQPDFYLSPDGGRFAVRDTSSSSGPFSRGVMYVMQPGGETLRLDGFTVEEFRGWSPDGHFFIASGYAAGITSPAEQSRDYYLLEPGLDEAVLIGHASRGSSLHLDWSPDGSTIAFTEGTDLVLFDIARRQRNVIPLGLALTDSPHWSLDGRYIAVGDGVVDVQAGSVLVSPQAAFVLDSEASPGGAYLTALLDPFGTCDELQDNQTTLVDVSTGERHVLFDCDGSGVDDRVDWIAPDRFLLLTVPCYACETSAALVTLVTLPGGEEMELTDGLENGGAYAISPDRNRILVGGETLRLYDSSGTPLRVIEPPKGYKITGMSWSNDGLSFAYVVGPATVNLI